MVFTALTFAQLAHVMAIRSDRDSLLTIGLVSNRPLAITVTLTVALQLLPIYTPVSNRRDAADKQRPGGQMVGLDGFEPSTPALSRRCSNRLSYRPSR